MHGDLTRNKTAFASVILIYKKSASACSTPTFLYFPILYIGYACNKNVNKNIGKLLTKFITKALHTGAAWNGAIFFSARACRANSQ